MRQFYGHLEKCVLSAVKTVSVKFLLFRGGFGGGGGSADFIFMGARIFLKLFCLFSAYLKGKMGTVCINCPEIVCPNCLRKLFLFGWVVFWVGLPFMTEGRRKLSGTYQGPLNAPFLNGLFSSGFSKARRPLRAKSGNPRHGGKRPL